MQNHIVVNTQVKSISLMIIVQVAKWLDTNLSSKCIY